MYANLCQKHKKVFLKILIYFNFMLIYVNITDGQTDKHTKSIVRNLTKFIMIKIKIKIINRLQKD